MSQQLSEKQLSKLKETIRKRIREFTSTANVAGYDTPHAFGKDTKGDIKRKVKSAGKGFEYAKSISENRWLELKKDETRTPSQKVSHGIRELKNQLAEIEKFVGWYNRLRSENNLGKHDFFKRTNTNIYRIKERIIKIANSIQEIDKSENEDSIEEVDSKKAGALEKYAVTATPKGSNPNAKRVTLTKPAPKATAETQAASFRKMDKYQTIRLKKA
jgi:hypothetical protein